MGISPWYKTTTPTAPIWTIQLVPDAGIFNVAGLSVGNFALLIRNIDTGVETSGAGSFANITAGAGATPSSVQYQAAVADVTLGNYRLAVLVTTGSGVQPFVLTETWQVVTL
jgi:hypothetical protein